MWRVALARKALVWRSWDISSPPPISHAVDTQTLIRLMQEAGYVDVQRLDDGFFSR
jgi:hypothetical protein